MTSHVETTDGSDRSDGTVLTEQTGDLSVISQDDGTAAPRRLAFSPFRFSGADSRPVKRIACSLDDLEEGLFGQVLLWVFELLPWLAANDIRPHWDIRSRLYGAAPEYRVLPGVFDIVDGPTCAQAPAAARLPRAQSLLWARVLHLSVLGGDWRGTHALWTRFFRVPERIERRADAVALPSDCLGLHYRGTDKNKLAVDTNPVAVDDVLRLAAAVLSRRPELRSLFVASDEPGLLALVSARFPQLDVRGLGDVPFHKADGCDAGTDKADRALLDCVLLSRCRVVLKCSSALSGFAKVLNPDLECYRLAASKMFSDVPYFPDAYVPRLELDDTVSQTILARLFEGDWLDDERARTLWEAPFVARPRYGRAIVAINALKYGVSAVRGRLSKAWHS